MTDQFVTSNKQILGDSYLEEYDVQSEQDLIINIISNSYRRDVIERWLGVLETVCSQDYTHESSMVLVQQFGRRLEKLKMYKHEHTFKNVRHLYGTLLTCIELMDLNYDVHLIESISCDGIKKMGDIDIMASRDSKIHLIDYTQIGNKKVWQSTKHEDKMMILQSKFLNIQTTCRVTSQELPVHLFNLKFGSEVPLYGNYVQDFQNAECMMTHAMAFNKDDCVEVLENYANDIIGQVGPGSKKLIRTLDKGHERLADSIGRITTMIQHNGFLAASTFADMCMGLTSAKARTQYSLDHFEELELLEEKPTYNTPLARRHPGLVGNDPFLRLEAIVQAMKEHFRLSNPLIMILMWCKDGEVHPTEEEIKILRGNPIYFKYEGITAQRVKHRNGKEFTNSVRVHFRGEFESLESLAFGTAKTKVLVSDSRTDKQCNSYIELEEILEKEKKWAVEPSTGSRYFDDMNDLIDNVLPESNVSTFVRETMRNILSLIKSTRLGSAISFQQEIAIAVCNVPRKKKISKNHHDGFRLRTAHLSLDCVSDRFAVAITNMSSTLNSNKDQTLAVAGFYEEEKSTVGRGHEQGLSEWFNMSAADLDWNVTLIHKLLSWLSLEVEEVLVNEQCLTKERIMDIMIVPSMIMLINDQKFAQASEMVRYIFVNSTGISGGTQNLYEKIRWYKPDSFISKLYLLRMMKMSTGVQWMKAMNKKQDLLCKFSSDMTDGSHLHRHFTFKHWTIAFPHESKFVPSDVHTYNSFYICKAFTVQRHNRLMSESQVVLKQLEARRAYLTILEENRSHEIRFVPIFNDSHEFKTWLLSLNYSQMKTEAFSPSPAVVLLGAFATLLRTHKTWNGTVGELVLSNYLCGDVPRNLHVSDILNNHGSVASMGSHGLVVSNYEKKEVKEEIDGKIKKVTKNIFHNQNSKCYITVLRDIHDLMTNSPAKSIPEDWSKVQKELDDNKGVIDQAVLESSLRQSNLIWPLVARHLTNMTQFVSKMTHKDQIGSREIATLNAAARVCCYYVEEFSRYIRDSEHKFGMTTDLIERKDKEEIVKAAFNKSRINHQDGMTVVYDSADCSKWGPSMLSPILYISLGMRVRDDHIRESIMRCLHLFSNKVFKVPDALYMSTNLEDGDEQSSNSVSKARNEIKNMVWPLGRPDLQIINLPESMHQGILGVTSSILGTDMQNLSRYVSMKAYGDLLTIDPFITSDDYTRILTFRAVDEQEETLSTIIKKTLSIHCLVSNGFGIKRNMEKSTHSTVVLEFNSIFHTPSSENRPDIKSRLSYVDFGQSYDPYPNALECLSRGSEFLRSEGSLHGACWVQLLNTHLSMMQNQSLPLFRAIGASIFQVPLELGGYAKIDPINAVMSSKHMPLMENYCPTVEFNPRLAIKLMMELRPVDVEEISLDPEDAIRSRVPKLSRSGVIHLCRRDKRESRRVREFIKQIPREFFTDLRFPGSKYSLLPALLSCMQREETTASAESASVRFSVPQTPLDALVYRLNSPTLVDWFDSQTLVSRKMMHEKAIWFASERIEPTGYLNLCVDDFSETEIPFFYDNFIAERKSYLTRLSQIKPLRVVAVNKRTHQYPLRDVFVPSMWFEQATEDFNREFKPKELGGNTDISPQLFLESVMMYRAKLQDLVIRKQVLKLTLMEMDATPGNLMEKILLGAFMNGGRLTYDKSSDVFVKHSVEDNISFLLRMFAQPSWKDQWGMHGDLDFDLLDPRVVVLAKQHRLKWLNVTNLLNASMDTSEFMSFSDVRSKMEVWHAIKDGVSDFQSTPLMIEPNKVNLNAHHEVFKLGGMSKIYSQPVRFTGDEVVGKEIIQEKVNGTHNHFYVMTKDVSYTIPEDTATDHYEMRDLSLIDKLPVKLKNMGGFLMMTTMDGYPIQVLCSSVPEINNKVYIHFERRLLTKDIITRLGLSDPYSGLSDSIRKILTDKMVLYHDEKSQNSTPPPERDNDVELMADWLDYADSDDEEGGLSIEMDGLLDFLEDRVTSEQMGILPGLEEPTDWLGDEGPPSDNESEHEREESVVSRIPSVGSYVSAYGVFHPTSTLLSTKAYGQMSEVPQGFRRNIPLAVRTERSMVINLPFSTQAPAYSSGASGTGLTALLDELSAVDSTDSSWFVSYIRDCIVSSAVVMGEISIVMKESTEEEEW